jgi:outer membrane receptor protein involved in Fe transport
MKINKARATFNEYLLYTLLPQLLPILANAAGLPTTDEIALDTVLVSGNQHDLTGVADSASEGTVTDKQLANRPLLRPAEVMEAIPGMMVTQHSGDGKANQYFLRGFNLDHGSDFATYVNGMPVNNVTHAHGQGYTDLNFLIPELISNLRYRKGVYAAEDGDLAVAGSARIDYLRSLPNNQLNFNVGANGYKRGLAVGSRDIGDFSILGAIELSGNDGPWVQPEGLGKQNAVLRLSTGTVADGYSLTAMAYQADWTATEQVPQRAIDSGEISRYGTLAPTDGGKTHRYSLSAQWGKTDDYGNWKANAYWINYGLNLFSTPSGLLDGQHEQADRRNTWGGGISRSQTLPLSTLLTIGTQLRQDNIGQLGLCQTINRQRTATTLIDKVSETGLGLYADANTQWKPWLRTTAGLRWDNIQAEVTPVSGTFNASNGGNTSADQVSPKLSVTLGPFNHTEFYANWGYGFHSNDARGSVAKTNVSDGTIITGNTPLIAKAKGSEVGIRTQPLQGWFSSLSLWQMDLASELVYIGDSGVTEPKGSSKRYGLEWSNYYSNQDGWILDADLALSHARFNQASNGGTYIPNAIPITTSLAATYDLGGTWSAGLRMRYIGAYALEETNTEKSNAFWTTNLKVGYRYDKKLQFSLDILNLFDSKANDIEYFGASCSNSEGSACAGGNGIDGRLIHPLEPRTLRVGMNINL